MDKYDYTDPIYHDEDAAWAHYEATVWPNGPVCPHCGVIGDATRVQAKETTRTRTNKKGEIKTETWTRRGVHTCNSCGDQFTATTATVFESSHIPMHKWLHGAHLFNQGKRGVSAAELQRALGFGSYRTAWFMAMRLREAAPSSTDPLGGAGKIVEADETYYGRSNTGERTVPKSKKQPHRDRRPKRAVVALVERGGKARTFHVGNADKETVARIIRENVHPDTRLHTDESNLYPGVEAHVAEHETVRHSAKEYVRGDVHTNSVEGFFGQFKRGMVGVYGHCDEKYLARYVREFEHRHNTRSKLGFTDKERATLVVKGAAGKRLTLRQPKGVNGAA